MKFKEKTYIITLVLFLIFLNAGIFSLAFYTHNQNTKAAESLCTEEKTVIAEAFSDDITYLGHAGRAQVMISYGSYYEKKNIYIAFYSSDGKKRFSNIPDGFNLPKEGYVSTQRSNGTRMLLISESIYNGQYVFTYAKDVTYLDEDFKSISIVFIITSLGASGLLAIILFFVLHKLSIPLERLREATGEIANGNLDIRADDTGKDEFSLLASDFNRMAEHISAQMKQLEESAETKQQMLDNLAHEMRTPLTSIRGYAEYLLNANIDEAEKTEATEYIITESERLKAIGERLLDDAFIRENGIKEESSNLGEIAADAAKKMSFTASQNGVELKVEASSISCRCDPLLIGMLMTNLIGNAIKACRGNGTVAVGCYTENESAVLFVRDNGVGMTEEQLQRITEPFYRTDRSRAREDGGTGLGLALCDRIVKAHGATLDFRSVVGEGTSAYVIFKSH